VLVRQFLEFAEAGRQRGGESHAVLGALEEDIIREWQARGFSVQPLPGEAGRPDLAVVDPTNSPRNLLGSRAAGPPYCAGSTARARDRLRNEELQRLGWKLHPIWAPAWVFHRQKEMDRLLQAVKHSA